MGVMCQVSDVCRVPVAVQCGWVAGCWCCRWFPLVKSSSSTPAWWHRISLPVCHGHEVISRLWRHSRVSSVVCTYTFWRFPYVMTGEWRTVFLLNVHPHILLFGDTGHCIMPCVSALAIFIGTCNTYLWKKTVRYVNWTGRMSSIVIDGGSR